MLQVRIDDPADYEIPRPAYDIRGWLSSDENVKTVEFAVGAVPVGFSTMMRPDVEMAFPGHTVRGFILHLDLRHHMTAVRNRRFQLIIRAGSQAPADVTFTVAPSALASCLAAAGGL